MWGPGQRAEDRRSPGFPADVFGNLGVGSLFIQQNGANELLKFEGGNTLLHIQFICPHVRHKRWSVEHYYYSVDHLRENKGRKNKQVSLSRGGCEAHWETAIRVFDGCGGGVPGAHGGGRAPLAPATGRRPGWEPTPPGGKAGGD